MNNNNYNTTTIEWIINSFSNFAKKPKHANILVDKESRGDNKYEYLVHFIKNNKQNC